MDVPWSIYFKVWSWKFSLRRRVDANSGDKTKLAYHTKLSIIINIPYRRSITVSLETCPSHLPTIAKIAWERCTCYLRKINKIHSKRWWLTYTRRNDTDSLSWFWFNMTKKNFFSTRDMTQEVIFPKKNYFFCKLVTKIWYYIKTKTYTW